MADDRLVARQHTVRDVRSTALATDYCGVGLNDYEQPGKGDGTSLWMIGNIGDSPYDTVHAGGVATMGWNQLAAHAL